MEGDRQQGVSVKARIQHANFDPTKMLPANIRMNSGLKAKKVGSDEDHKKDSVEDTSKIVDYEEETKLVSHDNDNKTIHGDVIQILCDRPTILKQRKSPRKGIKTTSMSPKEEHKTNATSLHQLQIPKEDDIQSLKKRTHTNQRPLMASDIAELPSTKEYTSIMVHMSPLAQALAVRRSVLSATSQTKAIAIFLFVILLILLLYKLS